MERDFKGIWIPKELYLDSELSWTEKILLVEVDSLASNNECFASNEYLATFLGVSKDRVSKILTKFEREDLITREVAKDGRRVIHTYGYRQKYLPPIGKNTYGGIGKNTYHNNIDNIKPFNNKDYKGAGGAPAEERSYFPDEKLDAEFREYIKYRKQMKKPLTEHATDLCMKKLAELSGNSPDTAIRILQQSMSNGWTGLFALKEDKPLDFRDFLGGDDDKGRMY